MVSPVSNKARILNYEEISVGDVFSFQRLVEEKDGEIFSQISGDYNPLHVNPPFAQAHGFNSKVVHGMFAASLFSRLVGMECPGEKSLYLSQTLNFKNPIYAGDTLLVKGQVSAKSDSIKVITLQTQILKDSVVMVDGIAKVKVL